MEVCGVLFSNHGLGVHKCRPLQSAPISKKENTVSHFISLRLLDWEV